MLDSGVPLLLVDMVRKDISESFFQYGQDTSQVFLDSEEKLAHSCKEAVLKGWRMKFLSVDSSIVSQLRAHWVSSNRIEDPLEPYADFDGLLFIHAAGRLSNATMDDLERLLNRRRLMKRNTMIYCSILQRRIERDVRAAEAAARKAAEAAGKK